MITILLKSKQPSDAAYVEGAYEFDREMERGLHKLCREYYEKTFRGIGVDEEGRKDILQNALLSLWDNIRNRIIYVEDGKLKGKDGEPFTSTLTTYFMGIVNNKYLEWLRKNPQVPPVKDVPKEVANDGDWPDDWAGYDDDTIRKLRIISNRMSHMAKQCNKILTLYYYEERNYDEMLELMPTFKSKDALKTAKYKCLKRLHDSVTGTYC